MRALKLKLYRQALVSMYFVFIRGTFFFYVRRVVDLMKTAELIAYIMYIFGKIELLSMRAA